MRIALALAALCLVLAGVGPQPAPAQNVGVVQSDVLVLDTERLFQETELGQRILAEIQADREELMARNRKLEAELEAEEQRLTDLRAEKTPDEFRKLADAFDTKVQRIRRDSDRAVRDLERRRERAPVTFLRRVQPVLVELMRDAGGAVIIEARSVLLRADAVDVTDLAIARIDARIGDGTDNASGAAPAENAPVE